MQNNKCIFVGHTSPLGDFLLCMYSAVSTEMSSMEIDNAVNESTVQKVGQTEQCVVVTYHGLHQKYRVCRNKRQNQAKVCVCHGIVLEWTVRVVVAFSLTFSLIFSLFFASERIEFQDEMQ